jgi:hypothetical protein
VTIHSLDRKFDEHRAQALRVDQVGRPARKLYGGYLEREADAANYQGWALVMLFLVLFRQRIDPRLTVISRVRRGWNCHTSGRAGWVVNPKSA